MRFAEVFFFFRARVQRVWKTFALVSLYSEHDHNIFSASYGTVIQCKYYGEDALRVIPAQSIHAVVGMVPSPSIPNGLSNPDQDKFFVVEKLGFDNVRVAENFVE